MADIVTENGCRLVLENEATSWGATGIDAEHIIRQIGSDRIRLCWDPGNSARAGSICPFPDEYERIKDLMKKDLWHDEHSVTGLPKTKIIKIKAAKKEKKEEETPEGGTPAAEGEGEAKAETKAEKK